MNQSDRGYWLYLDWFLTAGITRANYCLYEQITNIIIERQYLTARINLWGDGRPCKSEEVSLERHKLGIFWKWLWKTSKYWERDSYQTIPTRWFWIHLRIKIHASFRATEPFRVILTDADVLLSEFNWNVLAQRGLHWNNLFLPYTDSTWKDTSKIFQATCMF